MASSQEGVSPLAAAIDTIEETYEYMLAYAAQGRRVEEDGSSSSIREFLNKSIAALDLVCQATPEMAGITGRQAIDDAKPFLDVLKDDAKKAQAAFRFVVSQRSIGSQIVDNLNASIHVRALLTDLFLLVRRHRRSY